MAARESAVRVFVKERFVDEDLRCSLPDWPGKGLSCMLPHFSLLALFRGAQKACRFLPIFDKVKRSELGRKSCQGFVSEVSFDSLFLSCISINFETS